MSLFASPTGRILLLRRSGLVTSPGVWSVPAGGIERGEAPLESALRELEEEAGYYDSLQVVDAVQIGPFYNFVAVVPREFRPKLNWENDHWGWFTPDERPFPTHPGVHQLLDLL